MQLQSTDGYRSRSYASFMRSLPPDTCCTSVVDTEKILKAIPTSRQGVLRGGGAKIYPDPFG